MNNLAVSLAVALLMVLSSLSPALAGAVGKFTAVEGRVDVLAPGQKRAAPVAAGSAVAEGDIVRTKSDSFAEITFTDGTVVKLTESTRLEIREYLLSGSKRQNGALKLLRGKVRATVAKGLGRVIPVIYSGPSTFRIETPTAVAGVKGTDFFVFYNMGSTGVFVLEGAVDTMGLDESHNVVRVRGGEYTIVEQNRPAMAAAASRDFVVSRHMKDADPERLRERRDRDRRNEGLDGREAEGRLDTDRGRDNDDRSLMDRRGRDRERERDFVKVSGREGRDFSDHDNDREGRSYFAQRYDDDRRDHEHGHDYDRPISEINTALLGRFDGDIASASADIVKIDADIEGSFRDDHTWRGDIDGDFTGGGSSTTFGGTMTGSFQNGSLTGTLTNGVWNSNGTWSANVTGTIPGGTFTGTLSGTHDSSSTGDIDGTGSGTWVKN